MRRMFDWVKIGFTTSVFIHGGTLTAQEIHRFSVKQAIEYGTQHNAMVKNAGLDYSMQEQVNRGVTAMALPQVSGSLGVTDNVIIPTTLIPGEFIGQQPGTFVPVQFGTQYQSYGSVTLKQTLFDGQVLVGLQARKTALDWVKKNGEVTEQKLRASIYKLYYALLLSNTQVALINANIESQQALLHDATAMYKSGFSEKLDVDRAQVQLSNLEAQKVQVLFNIENAGLALKAVLAMPVKDSLSLTDTITYEMVKAGSLSDTLGVYSQRRDYQYLELTKKLNEYDVKRYKKTYIPTLSLTVNYAQNAYGQQWRVFKSGVWYGSAYGGLSVNVPIFDGFAKDANVQKAKITLRQTENLLSDKKLSIDNDIKQAQARFKSAMENLNSQKGNMELAQNVYDQTRKKYEQGVGSNTEITTALRDLTQAQNAYIDALFSAVQAKIDYQDAIGRL